MNDIEKRARELLADELEKVSFPSMAAEVRDEDGENTIGQVMVRVVTAAITPPEGWAAQHARDSKELRKLCESRDFYKRRCEALESVQSNMRDPERKAVCDILANGSTSEFAARPEVNP